MVNKSAACPDRETLLSLLDEASGTESVAHETVVRHVTDCQHCQFELDRLTDSAELAEYRHACSMRTDASRHFSPPTNDKYLGSLDGLAIERQVGAGGMGDVFLATDQKLARRVAVKILSRCHNHESDARFVREAKSAARIRSDNVVSVYSTGRTADGTPYLVMPMIDGQTLKEYLAIGNTNIRETVSWIRQIAIGLNAAHELGMIHRDVKPGNILLDDSDGRAKLTDFGLVRSMEDRTLTKADVITGTPGYMSPEQADGITQLNPLTDIYSLGITLYEALTGTIPFQGQPLQILEQHRTSPALRPSRLNPEVPRDIETVCLKAIAKSPAQRFQSASAFADDLQRFLEGRPVLARETTKWEHFRMWCRRNKKIAMLAATSVALLLAVVIGSGAFALFMGSANKQIVKEKDRATKAEQLAISDRNAAIIALEKVVDSLYEEMSNNAATIKARESVVAAAIEGLEAVSKVEGDLKTDRTSFRALLRIGDLSFLKGDQEQGEENYERAIEIARAISKRNPADAGAKRDLAMALSQFAGNHLQLGSPKAAGLGDEATELMKQVVAKNPQDIAALVRLVVQHGQKLERIRNESPSEPQKVIVFGNSILGDVRQLFELQDNDPLSCESAHNIHFSIGRGYLESNNVDKAVSHFSEARTFLNKAISQNPDNVQLNAASAVLDRARAMALLAQARLDEAVPLFESAIQSLSELVTKNPEDVTQQQNLANTRIIASTAISHIGRHEDACRQLEQAISTYDKLLKLFPENDLPRVLKLQAHFQLAVELIVMNQFAECRTVCESLQEEFQRNEFAPNFLPGATFFYENSVLVHETTTWLLGEVPDKRSVSGECLALMVGAKRDARQASSETLSKQTQELIDRLETQFDGTMLGELFDYVNQLEGLNPVIASQRKLFEALVFGFLAENASNSEDAKKDVQRFVQRAVAAIKDVAANTPPGQLNETIYNDCQISWLRETEQFKDAWNELTKPPANDDPAN